MKYDFKTLPNSLFKKLIYLFSKLYEFLAPSSLQERSFPQRTANQTPKMV